MCSTCERVLLLNVPLGDVGSPLLGLKVREYVQRILKIFQYAQSFAVVEVNIDPVHAGLPWAGVNVPPVFKPLIFSSDCQAQYHKIYAILH